MRGVLGGSISATFRDDFEAAIKHVRGAARFVEKFQRRRGSGH